MITCERFEKDFQAWQSGKLSPEDEDLFHRHVLECPHCKAFTQTAFNLRKLTLSLPKREPSPAFRYRLNGRLSDLASTSIKPVRTGARLLPRWAALGAGLASGLALGLVLILSTGPENGSGTGAMMGSGSMARNEAAPVKDVDTTDTSDDSIMVPEQQYDIDRRGQVVSGTK